MLTTEHLATFHAHGLIRLAGFMPEPAVRRAREAVLAPLGRLGERPRPAWPSAGEDAKTIRHCPLVDALIDGSPVRACVEALLEGAHYDAQLSRAQVLYTPPNADTWFVPHNVWHLDIPRLSVDACPGVQLFGLLDDVVPGGGGTLIVAGSHRLANEGRLIRSKDVKSTLARDPYFKALFDQRTADRDRFMYEPGVSADGVPLQVIELSGAVGDVYLMDMRVLHTMAPNTSDRARLMFTQRFVRADCVEEAFA